MRKTPPFSASGPHMSFLRSLPLKTNFLAIPLGPVRLLTLESAYGGGQIGRYTWAERIQQSGIEDLYAVSDYSSSTDEDHARDFIEIKNAQSAWVRNTTARYFADWIALPPDSGEQTGFSDDPDGDGIHNGVGG